MNTSNEWAGVDKDGTVLHVGDEVGDVSYRTWKLFDGAGEEGVDYTVVPHPDRDRPMLPLERPCSRCNGTVHQPDAVHAVPIVDGDLVIPDRLRPDPTRDHRQDTCPSCSGQGYVRKVGGPYRTPAALRAAITSGKAKKCRACAGSGEVAWLPILENCYRCEGHGKVPTWDPHRAVLPPSVSWSRNPDADFMAAYLGDVTITVVRLDRQQSWGEHNIGLGLYSCTDYGRAWNTGDDAALALTVGQNLLDSPPQYIKVIDKKTRRFARCLLVLLNRGGYSVVAADVPFTLPQLPPTYDGVYDRPYA